jgi:hypothetical protein
MLRVLMVALLFPELVVFPGTSVISWSLKEAPPAPSPYKDFIHAGKVLELFSGPG